MRTISKKQIGLVKTLINKLGLESPDLAYNYSDGRTEHISQLFGSEATELIKQLLNGAGKKVDNPAERMKRKIISMAHEMRWELPFSRPSSGTLPKSNVIDMSRVDGWCIKYGHGHKPLDQYTEAELPQLVTQFKRAYQDFLKGI